MILSLFCDKWEFCKCSPGTVYGDVKNWSEVDLPHDWLIYDTNDLYENSIGWYRRTGDIPDDGRRTALRFDGVYMDCRIYVNGVQAFKWKYGYTSFECDITKYLHTGKTWSLCVLTISSPTPAGIQEQASTERSDLSAMRTRISFRTEFI